MPLLKNLAKFFRVYEGNNIYTLAKAIDNSLDDVRQDIVGLDTEFLIFNSTGKWLDIWGKEFNIPRNSDEPYNQAGDSRYRNRILSNASKPRNTIPAIVSLVKTFVGNDEVIVVYEPFTNMRKFNISTFNGADKFPDGTYYRPSVIDIQTSGGIVPALREAVDKIKAAGVKVYFTFTGEASGPPIDMGSSVPPSSEYIVVIESLAVNSSIDNDTINTLGMSFYTEIKEDTVYTDCIKIIEMNAYVYKTITAGSLFIINDLDGVTVEEANIMPDDTCDSVEVITIP